MRKVILAILVLVVSAAASFGQTPKDSWANLKQLKPGHKIKVVDLQLKSWEGKLVSVSDESIIVREKSSRQEITVERPNVLRVTDLQRSHRARNALIGFAAGAPIGALTLRDPEAGEGYTRAYGAGLVGLVGAAIGAVIPPRRPTIYRGQQAPEKSTTVQK